MRNAFHPFGSLPIALGLMLSMGIAAAAEACFLQDPAGPASYSSLPMSSWKDGTLIKSDVAPTVYSYVQGQLHPVSRFVFRQRKFKNADVLTIPKAVLDPLPVGKPLPPPDGILVRGAARPAVYLIQDGKRYWVDLDVFIARKFDFKKILVIPDGELESLEYNELPFPNRTLLLTQGDPTVYLLIDGILRGINLPEFNKCGFQFRDIIRISPTKIKLLSRGADMGPADCPLPSEGK